VREYEVTVVLKPDLEDESQGQLIERIEGWLTHSDGEDAKPKQDHWGRRQLAYPIDNFTEGYYILFEASLDPTRIGELERNIIFAEDVLRHLVVRKDS
jgi:small subunit ribosomal protein S6